MMTRRRGDWREFSHGSFETLCVKDFSPKCSTERVSSEVNCCFSSEMEVVMLRQKLEAATRGSDQHRLRDVIRQAQHVPVDDYVMRRATRRLEILQIRDGKKNV